MRAESRKALRTCCLAGFAVGLICSFLAWCLPGNRLDAMIYDQWMRLRGATPPHPGIVIVDVDEKSLKELGQWPWPRDLLADLISGILAGGGAAIGLDMLLSEADRTSLAAIDLELRKRYGKGIDLSAHPDDARDHDSHFARLIRDSPIALGAYATYDEGELPPDMGKAEGIVEKTPPGAQAPRETVPAALGLQLPLAQFREGVPIGLINVGFEEDGIMRALPLVVRAGDNLYASLALRTLMLALNRRTMQIGSTKDGHLKLYMGPVRADLQRDGIFRPVFRGPAGTFPYVSASDVLSGEGGERLKGKIVFVGSSATGLVDYRSTPFDLHMPGVEFHATIADNLLTGSHILIPHWEKAVQIAAVFAFSFLAAFIFGFLPLLAAAALGLLLVAVYFAASWQLFQSGLFMTPVFVTLATVACSAIVISLRFWREQKGRRRIRQAFSRYVAPEAVARIAESGTRA